MTMNSEQKLKLAVKLLAADVIINIFLGCANLHLTLPNIGNAIKIVSIIIGALIYSFFIWQINLKQNWARIASLFFFIFSLIATAQNYAIFNNIANVMNHLGIANSTILFIYLIIPTFQRGLEGVAMYFLFTKDMNALFKKSK